MTYMNVLFSYLVGADLTPFFHYDGLGKPIVVLQCNDASSLLCSGDVALKMP